MVFLGGNVVHWISFGGNDVVRGCMGDNFALGSDIVFGVAVVGNVTV